MAEAKREPSTPPQRWKCPFAPPLDVLVLLPFSETVWQRLKSRVSAHSLTCFMLNWQERRFLFAPGVLHWLCSAAVSSLTEEKFSMEPSRRLKGNGGPGALINWHRAWLNWIQVTNTGWGRQGFIFQGLLSNCLELWWELAMHALRAEAWWTHTTNLNFYKHKGEKYIKETKKPI